VVNGAPWNRRKMKLPTIKRTAASKKAKDSKDNFDVENVFNTFAEKYDKWYDKPFGKTAFNLENECIKSLCKNLERPFLEIGVGTGRFAVSLEVKYSIDKSVEMLKFAKERGLEVIRGEGGNLPFVDASFGAAFLIVTLCFVDDPLKVLKETSRVLEDGGFVILGLIPKESPWASFYEKKGEEGNVFYKIAWFYTINKLKSMLKNVDLQISEVRSTILQPPTEEPLHFEFSREGYCKEAGFIAIRTQKRNSMSQWKSVRVK
jgi:ubiquinone/menaquinone biosynthesis C-methylase UbiE